MNPIQYFQWGETFVKPAFYIDLKLGYNGIYPELSRFDFDTESQTNLYLLPVYNSPVLLKTNYKWVDTTSSIVSMHNFPTEVKNAISFKNEPIKKIWMRVRIRFDNKSDPDFWNDSITVEVGKHLFTSQNGLIFKYNRINKDELRDRYEIEFTLPTPIMTQEFLKRFVITLPFY
ncbi:hypothetical protein RCZ04_16910 [Capnocytophaga sp. HP1101]